MDACQDAQNIQDEFVLDTPALICRWRLCAATLPLYNRHLRALSARSVNGERVRPELVSWAKQHIEWTLAKGALENPDGVLMLLIDTQGQAAMTVGPYVELPDTSTHALLSRAVLANKEKEAHHVAPECLWAKHTSGVLVCAHATEHKLSGVSSLVRDLATTLGIPLAFSGELLDWAQTHDMSDEFSEVFLASDEHGIVASRQLSGVFSERFVQSYAKLLAKTKNGYKAK